MAIAFGRGVREDLDYDEASVLVETMRVAVREEWYATFGASRTLHGSAAKGSTAADAEGSGYRGGNGRRSAWKV